MFRAVASSPPPTATAAPVHFYCSSGGNAGLACAVSAQALGRPATIVVPETTTPYTMDKLRAQGASVVQVGSNWAAADAHLREILLARDPGGVYVPPFGHPLVWEGAATLVDELGGDPHIDGIVCSVGGGGLLCGVMEGVERAVASGRWTMRPRVVAVETTGAVCLLACVAAGVLVSLPAFSSVA